MPETMDAIRLLEQDHKKVKGLFKEFEGMSDRAKERKMRMYRTIRMELEIHTRIEEEIFYPVARGVDEEMIAEATEEHHVVDMILRELEGIDASEDSFDAKMTVLQENVEHHIEEEEGELFPKVEKKIKKDQLSQLGEQMMQRKEMLAREMERAA